jgi:hypothetical protein
MPRHERDPERPDPAEPSRERVREVLIECQIRAAMDEGVFDGLPHQGRRLPLEDDSMAGDWAMAHRMLRNAGVAPAWIEADKIARDRLLDVERLHERAGTMSRLSRSRARAEVEANVVAANRAIAQVNAEAPTDRQYRRLLDLAAELDRFDGAAPTNEVPGQGQGRAKASGSPPNPRGRSLRRTACDQILAPDAPIRAQRPASSPRTPGIGSKLGRRRRIARL